MHHVGLQSFKVALKEELGEAKIRLSAGVDD
jgi:hypothetical protein